MKIGLLTSVVVSIFVCVLFIKLLSVDATCWVHCPAFQHNVLQPYCYINDEEGDWECRIYVSSFDLTELESQSWNKVNLFINVTNSVNLRVYNILSDYGLELRAFRNIDQVTRLHISSNNLIMSHFVLHYLQNLRYIYSYRVAFSHFPPFSINSKLTYLEIHYYTIMSNNPRIGSGLVSGLPNLKHLAISPLNRGRLENNALSGLTALTRIDLANIVSSDYFVTLSPLVRLKSIYFWGSMLSDITFLKQTPALYGLTHISFSNNRISSFPNDTFENYTQLNTLAMIYNPISVINRFYAKSVKTLYLYQNQITRVAEDAFRDTPMLTHISLSNNDITRLSSRTFEHLHQINSIYVYNNPLHCDCSLKWLYSASQEHGINIYDARCSTPVQHEGLSALASFLYTDCTEDLSYDCFSRTISCPVGSYCQDTRDSYKCVCEGESVGFSRTLNQCVNYESVIASSCCERCSMRYVLASVCL